MRTPRISRKHLKTSFSHVITQGIDRNFIFEDSADIKYYISIMYKLKEMHSIKIIAYCIMNNHAHILLEMKDSNDLSKYMQRLNTRYGRYYNQKYDRVGYVFRNRYKSEVIYDEEHLYNCIRYIYNNPVRAGMCNKPEQYPYSNYKSIPNNTSEKYVFIDTDDDKNAICENMLNEFLNENGIELIELRKNKHKLKKLIRILKDEYNISLRQISEKVKLGREMIRRIYNSEIEKI